MDFDYKPNKVNIAKRIARIFHNGDVVNLGIGLPTMVGDYIPEDVEILLQSENGFLGLGPAPAKGKEIPNLFNAGAQPVTMLEGGAYFDSATSFGIIRGGHVDYTVLGVLQVDQEGNLANYKIPGKMVPGMGGAMDLTVGAKTVICGAVHFDKHGNSKLFKRCSLPLTASKQVDYLVTDVAFFQIKNNQFLLKEVFAPYTAEYVMEHTEADVVKADDFKIVNLD